MARKSRRRRTKNSTNPAVTDPSASTDEVAETTFSDDSIASVMSPECDAAAEPEVSIESDDPSESAAIIQTSDWNDFAGAEDDEAVVVENPRLPERNAIADVVESSGELLNQLIVQFNDLSGMIGDQEPRIANSSDETEIESLRDQVIDLRAQLADALQQRNEVPVKAEITPPQANADHGLSWEDRKILILQQMEDETFDAEDFVETLQVETADVSLDPISHVEELHAALQQRDEEIELLTSQLQGRPDSSAGGIAMDETTREQLLDSDEVIREERERLQQLQRQWEERFRDGEINASLERAKLSRERRELSQKNAELEEQLAHFRREAEQTGKAGMAGSRRWLAKLGLCDGGN